MKRAGLALVILGLAAAPVGAGDNQPNTHSVYNSGIYGMTPLMSNPQPLLSSSGVPHAGCGTCSNCAPQSRMRGDNERLRRWLDFLTFRPGPSCCDCRKPTHYTPPLIAWFPCREGGCNAGHCANCTAGRALVGPRCNTCTTAQAAAPVAANSMPQRPTPASNSTTMMRQAPATMAPAQSAAPTTYQYSKPVNSGRVQPAVASTPAASSTGYRVQPSSYYLPRD